LLLFLPSEGEKPRSWIAEKAIAGVGGGVCSCSLVLGGLRLGREFAENARLWGTIGVRNAANLGSFRRESVILCIASFPSIWSLDFRFADFQMPDFKNRVKRLNVAVGQAVAVARKSLGIFLGTGS
jgi:hypothetical protein